MVLCVCALLWATICLIKLPTSASHSSVASAIAVKDGLLLHGVYVPCCVAHSRPRKRRSGAGPQPAPKQPAACLLLSSVPIVVCRLPKVTVLHGLLVEQQ